MTPTVTAINNEAGTASPNFNINKAGGQTLTIVGTNFPKRYPMAQASGNSGGQSGNLYVDLGTIAEVQYTATFNIYNAGTAVDLCSSIGFNTNQKSFTCITNAITFAADASTEFKLCITATWEGTASTVCSTAFTGAAFDSASAVVATPSNGNYQVSPAYKRPLSF